MRSISHKISDIPITENELVEFKSLHGNTNVAFEGEITSVDHFVTKNGTYLYTWIVSDEEDSIYVKKFVKRPEEVAFMRKAKKGMLAKIKGIATFDEYQGEVGVTALIIERTTSPVDKDERVDLLPEKRVE